jgi:LysM repeat protein
VEWGETWYGIARENGISPRDLSAANPDVDPEHLRSGEVIRIPRSAASAARRTHRVVAGETLWGISRRYGVPAAEIRKANHLTGDKVRTGQLLVIPQEENRR